MNTRSNPDRHRQPAHTRRELDEHFESAKANLESRDRNSLKLLGVGAIGSLALLGGYEIADNATYDTLATASSVIQQGETTTDAVQEAAASLAEEHGIDPAEISGIVATAQTIGGNVQPGYTVTVDLEKNLFGKTRISPHETAEE